MLEYATVAEIWPTNEPANAAGLALHANGLVGRVTRTAFYKTDATGLPSDEAVAKVFKDAVTEQAKFWDAQGLDPSQGEVSLGRTVASKSIGGAQVQYEAGSGAGAKREALTGLCATGYLILDSVGLLNGKPVRR